MAGEPTAPPRSTLLVPIATRSGSRRQACRGGGAWPSSGEAVGQHADGHAVGPGRVVGPAHDGGDLGARPPGRRTARRPGGPGPGGRSPRSGAGRCDTPAEPSAGSGGARPAAAQAHRGAHRARRAVGAPAAADRGPQLHHRLVPRPRPSPPGRRRPPASSASAWASAGRRRPARPAGEHPADVGVDDADRPLEGERQHRPGRVRARRRAGPAAPPRSSGSAPAVPLDHRLGAAVEVDGPPVVAEPRPRRTTSPAGAAAQAAGSGTGRGSVVP